MSRRPRPTVIANVLKYGLLTLAAAVMLAPLLFALYTSLQDPSDYLTLVGLDRLTLQNYEYVISNAPIVRWYANTVLVTVFIVLGAVGVNTAAGYVLARIDFPGRRPLFLLVLAILMVPLQAYLIPLYLLIAQLGWLNSYQALILPFIVNPFLVFLMRQSFQALPKDLEEAASIDGAGRFTSFIRIAVPLTMTGIATQAVLAGTWTWNSFVIPVTMTTDKDLYVLTVGLNSLQSRFYTLPTIQMAGVVLLTIPVVLMFVAFQRFIVPSLASTGIKG